MKKLGEEATSIELSELTGTSHAIITRDIITTLKAIGCCVKDHLSKDKHPLDNGDVYIIDSRIARAVSGLYGEKSRLAIYEYWGFNETHLTKEEKEASLKQEAIQQEFRINNEYEESSMRL